MLQVCVVVNETVSAVWPLVVVPVWRWVSGGARTSAPWWWAGFLQALLCHPHLQLPPTLLLQRHLPAAPAPTLSPSQPHWRGACSTLDTAIWSHSAPGGHRRTWMSEWISLQWVKPDCSNHSDWLDLLVLTLCSRGNWRPNPTRDKEGSNLHKMAGRNI